MAGMLAGRNMPTVVVAYVLSRLLCFLFCVFATAADQAGLFVLLATLGRASLGLFLSHTLYES